MSNCVIERDAAGNRKLSKKRSTGRIDGAIALTTALGVAALRTTARFDVEALIAQGDLLTGEGLSSEMDD
jgi:phage terminase large subunit-like protein